MKSESYMLQCIGCYSSVYNCSTIRYINFAVSSERKMVRVETQVPIQWWHIFTGKCYCLGKLIRG